MKKKRVEFLRYFNDFRMILMFPADVVAITFFVFVISYSILAFGGAPLSFLVLGSFIIDTCIVYVYVQAKKNSSKGFLKHLFFNIGLYELKHDPKKWKELQENDTGKYFPNGNDKFFAD